MRVLCKMLLVLTIAAFSPREVETCSCVGGVPNLSKSLGMFEMAFIGVCRTSKIDTLFFYSRRPHPDTVKRVVSTSQFVVKYGLKNSRKRETVIVRSPLESNACGVHFAEGGTYIVFGNDTRNRKHYSLSDTTIFVLEVSKCSATQAVTKPAVDTLRKLTGIKIKLPY
jgi:hypothetical protein